MNERMKDVRSSVPCLFLLSLFIQRDLRAASLRLTMHGAHSALLPEIRQLVAVPDYDFYDIHSQFEKFR